MTEIIKRTEVLLPGPAQALGALLGVPVRDQDTTLTAVRDVYGRQTAVGTLQDSGR